ncbi:MAG: lipopolysaccharide transport periplasmic protein LptA [Burkholderiaceae bacterium]|nr:lipopolysaccharide transport periplasmic protein LptA [Burkholderiaceae bacterium]
MKRAAFALLLAVATAAQAERADRDKPLLVEAQKGSYNDLKQIGVFTGNVIVTKGTLRITGERVEVRKDPEGYEYAVVTAAPGKLAQFRQRRDPSRPGVEEIIEGESERIEYDGRAETVKLIAQAKLVRLENALPRDELRGKLIVYDHRSAQYSADGDAAGEGRVRAVIAPRESPPPAASPAPLRPAPELKR